MLLFLKSKYALVCLTLLSSFNVDAIEEYLVVKRSLSFGEVVPRIGSCTLDPSTLLMSSPTNGCLNNNHVAEVDLIGDPSTVMRIEFLNGVNAVSNITYFPRVRLTNNIGGDVTTVLGANITNFSTGTDGKITMLIGGQLSIGSSLTASTAYAVNYDIDYRKQ